METQLIADIEQAMLAHLDNQQMEHLHQVLTHFLRGVTSSPAPADSDSGGASLLTLFIAAKRVEGCSGKSLRYYESTLNNMLAAVDKPVKRITTDDLRQYLDNYQRSGGAGKVTIDNIRRILSSFFSWLEEENLILKNPMRRIHKVKTGATIKETYSDEALELMRDHCGSLRDLAIIDLLASTGMRVGELVRLNRMGIDFNNRECVVFGKGDKERKVYFDARTKIHLRNYIDSRTDDNPALFVTMQRPHERLQISGVEIRLRELAGQTHLKFKHFADFHENHCPPTEISMFVVTGILTTNA